MKLRAFSLYIITFIMCIVCVMFGLAQDQEEIHLNFGSGSNPQSSNFPYHATVNQLFDAAPGVKVSMTIPGGSVTGAMELLRREIDISGGLDLTIMYQMTNGLGTWEGNPLPNDLRVIGILYERGAPVVVTKGSNINSLRDLDGKTYSFGFPGSSSQQMFDTALKNIGINVDTYPGSYDDALTAIRDGRIAGYAKTSPAGRIDSGLLDIMFQKPLKIIGFSDEDILKIREEAPYLIFKKIPENYYEEVGNVEMNELVIRNAWLVHKDMPEDIAYKITKSYVDGWEEELLNVYGPRMATQDPAYTPELISAIEGIYLHPGSLRYYREIGVDIPDSVIPPESR